MGKTRPELVIQSNSGFQSVAGATPAEWNSALSAAGADPSSTAAFLIIAPSERDCDQFRGSAALQGNIREISVFPLRDSSELARDWSELPPGLAVRCAPPEDDAVVMVPLDRLIGPTSDGVSFRDVDSPIWDWLIRQVDGGQVLHLGNAMRGNPEVPPVRPPLAPADVGRGRRWLEVQLADRSLVDAPASPADAVALRAGLLIMHDFLEAGHQLAQSIEGQGRHAAGDYWHAIMHRREPDYGNSKYWFRHVGSHPVFAELAHVAGGLLQPLEPSDAAAWRSRLHRAGTWDPMAFVDLCEECAADAETPLALAAREIQWQEMRLLLRQTYRDAEGRTR
ncbi:MAG: hypothetical protein KF861_17600 [Planctomycetaceae bacterium]|nr:hypothetical protein [Planctomycetaceae bacterium]